ncbi:MAG: BTAD domain-containing putative transcriptional regulator [Trueperaceae bacterium]|nr:BTAD domain-containing putative transcriptional regulator [Trueperaceae bacterium]
MQLRLLGPPRLWAEGEGLEPPSLHLLLLSAYLASHDVWVERGQIVGWLWPDDDEKAGRHNLSQLLYRHRNKPWLAGFESTPHKLRWQTESDVRLFRQAVADGRWADALTHYGGAFLEDVLVDDAATVMDWLEQERSDLQNAWRDATLQYARQLHDAGAFAAAAKRLATAVQHDTLAEDVLQAYLESAAKAGQRDQALQAFARFEAQLADELAMVPLASTRALADAIRDGTLAPPVTLAATPDPDEAAADTSARSSSPASSTRRRAHPLPNDLTSFVGRDPERLDLAQMLADPDCRLLSILGPGGMGKSRLATHVAREQSAHFADRSVFVALAPLTSEAGLPMALTEAVGLEPHPTRDPIDHLCDYLADKTLLIVIDNAEHLRAAAADVVTRLLDAAPTLKIIATSREALGLRGEWRYELSGLAFPDDPRTRQVEAYDAVRLFVQSARHADPHLHLSAADRVAVATVCTMVQGVPLGIELAAAWLRLLGPQELAAELARDLDLLESDAANIPDRHRSLRAVFEGTWSLLAADERRLLARLSVFRGGLSKEAAQQVAGATLRTLLGLVNKSLLSRRSNGRFEMLDMVRHYAAEKLAADDRAERDTKARHARYYLSLAETAAPKLTGSEQTEWLEHLATDHDNLRVALDWSLAERDADTSLRLGAALWWF